jgi:hypothetical protein
MSVQEGSIGVEILYTVLKEDGSPENISSANIPGAKKLVFTKAKGIVMIKDALFATDGLDGTLKYVTTTATDLTPAGNYRVQAELVMPVFQGRTAPDVMNVCANPK